MESSAVKPRGRVLGGKEEGGRLRETSISILRRAWNDGNWQEIQLTPTRVPERFKQEARIELDGNA
jgi:hypothetical protein